MELEDLTWKKNLSFFCDKHEKKISSSLININYMDTKWVCKVEFSSSTVNYKQNEQNFMERLKSY